jgi:O-antigen/teichoic acid export membrane protein
LSAVQLAAARGLGDIRPLILVDQLIKPIGRLVLVSVAIGTGGGIVVVILVWSAWQWVVTGASSWLLSRRTRGLKLAEQLDQGLSRALGSFVRSRSVSASIEIAGANVGLLIIGAFATIEAAGVYSVASRLVLAGFLSLQAVRLVVAPLLSRHLSTDDSAAASALHQTSSAWVVLTAWPPFLLLLIWPGTVLSLFGSEFSQGSEVAVILALGGLFSVAVGNVQTVMLMGGLSGRYLLVTAASFVLNSGLAIVLVQYWDAEGVAIAATSAVVFENVLIAWVVGRSLHVRPVGPVVIAAMGVCLLAWVLPAAVVRLIGGDTSVTTVVITSLVSAALFAILCWCLRASIGLTAAGQAPAELSNRLGAA